MGSEEKERKEIRENERKKKGTKLMKDIGKDRAMQTGVPVWKASGYEHTYLTC